jgi:hypothetical protein
MGSGALEAETENCAGTEGCAEPWEMGSVGFKRETKGCVGTELCTAGPWVRGAEGCENVSEICDAAVKCRSDAIN